MDCSACGSSGHAISGDMNLLERMVMKTDARYIIVVEKVFGLLKFSINIMVILISKDFFSYGFCSACDIPAAG